MIMNLQLLTNYCLSKKGSLEDYPFGNDVLVVKVVSKMFALISNQNNQLQISLKCDPFRADSLRQQYAAITPGYHLNKNHWNTILIDGTLSELEICKMIDHSYELVFKGLKKSEKESVINNPLPPKLTP